MSRNKYYHGWADKNPYGPHPGQWFLITDINLTKHSRIAGYTVRLEERSGFTRELTVQVNNRCERRCQVWFRDLDQLDAQCLGHGRKHGFDLEMIKEALDHLKSNMTEED